MELKKSKIKFYLSIVIAILVWLLFLYVNIRNYINIFIIVIGTLSVVLFSSLYYSVLKSYYVRTCSFAFARSLLFNLKWGANYKESLEASCEKIKGININISLEDTSLSLEFKKLKLGYLNSLITTIIDSANNGKKLFIRSMSIDYILKMEIDKKNEIELNLSNTLSAFLQINCINLILFFMCVINQSFEIIISNSIMYIWLIIILSNLCFTLVLNGIKGEI